MHPSTLLAFTLSITALAQPEPPAVLPAFAAIDAPPPAVQALPARVRPLRGARFQVRWDRLRDQLSRAPLEGSGLPEAVVPLPLPDGTFQRFAVVRSPIMEPGLAASVKGIETFAARSLDDPACSARLDVTPHGFHAFARGPSGVFLIDPYSARDTTIVTSYSLADCRPAPDGWECLAGRGHGTPPIPAPSFEDRGPATLRTYRLAMACTGEYGLHHSTLAGHAPNADDPFAAIVTVVNRVNLVYESDVGVRFVLVANNLSLVFFDPDTDPYNGQDSNACLSANPGVINPRIGSLNYDIGHVLTRIPGGVAYLGCVCTSNKAGGVSGIPRGGDDDPLSPLVVIHEIGHQFGAGHAFNGVVGRCQANFMAASAWEPGGGSTPMAYPGACPVGNDPPGDNLVIFADPFLNSGSIGQMRTFIMNTGSCAPPVQAANAAPEFDSLPDPAYAVPPLTPFALAAHATDPDGDAVTYSWEERDLGPQRALTDPDNGRSPLFRVYPPVSTGERVFPAWPLILHATPIRGERFPEFAPAARAFIVTARDQRAGGGGTTIAPPVTVNITPGPPFAAIWPRPGATAAPGPMLLRWNAGDTALPPFGVSHVRITLSDSDGSAFPITLAAAAPNTGQAVVDVPPLSTREARIRVEALGNVFFCVSGAFTVNPCPGDFNMSGATPDDADIVAFFLAWNDGDPGADINQSDGAPDDADIAVFLERWSAGC